MSSEQVPTNEQIEAYLRKELKGQALDDFEVMLLANPELLESVTHERDLKRALQNNPELLENTSSESAPKAKQSIQPGRTFEPYVWGGLATCTFVLGLFLGSTPGTTAIIIDDIKYVETTRSASRGSVQTIHLSAERTTAVSIDLSSGTSSTPMEIAIMQGKKVISKIGPTTTSDNAINLLIPPLQAGEYQLELRANDEVSAYNLNVTRG